MLGGQPVRGFYANDLIKLAVSGSAAVQRELVALARSSLISMKQVGYQKHYRASANSAIFTKFGATIQKTIRLADPLKLASKTIEKRGGSCGCTFSTID